jgi:hypothetical protein
MEEPKMFNTEMTKQILDYQKNSFDTVYGTITKIQDQVRTNTNELMKQMPYIPAEGKKAIDTWADAFKDGQAELKKMVDKGFETAKTMVVNPMETAKK